MFEAGNWQQELLMGILWSNMSYRPNVFNMRQSNLEEMSYQFSPRQKLEENFHPSIDFQNYSKFKLNSKSIPE